MSKVSLSLQKHVLIFPPKTITGNLDISVFKGKETKIDGSEFLTFVHTKPATG